MASVTDITETMQALFCAMADFVGSSDMDKPDSLWNIETYKKDLNPYQTFKSGWNNKYGPSNTVDGVFKNHVKSGKVTLHEIESFAEGRGKIGIDWFMSSILISKKLIQDIDTIDKEFGNIKKPKWSSIFYEHRSDTMNKIEKLWKHANTNTKKLKNIPDSKIKFIPFGDVNKWSPADIYFTSPKAEKKIDNIFSDKQELASLTFIKLNGIISDLIDTGDLLPLSLKKQTNEVRILKVNFNKDEEWKKLETIKYHKFKWEKYPTTPNKKPPARDLKIFLSGTHSINDAIVLRHDASTNAFRGEILLKGMEARAGGLGFEQILGIVGIIDSKLSSKLKTTFNLCNTQFKNKKKPIREEYEKKLKSLGIDVKSKSPIEQKKVAEVRKSLQYAERVGFLSATLVTNKIMKLIIDNLLEDNEIAENFVRMVYAYSASQSGDSAKFVIAK